MEEEDVDWYEVRALGGLSVRAAPRWAAQSLGELVRQQRIQVIAAQRPKGWLRLSAIEMWLNYGRATEAYVPMEDEGFPTVAPISAPGGDWDQLAALLCWWPLGGLPPLVPATHGGAYLCHWRMESAVLKAQWLQLGEELQFVGPADTKAGQLCQWLKKDMALSGDLDVVLVQDQLALDGCARLLDHTDMKTVTRPFCALTFRRPRLFSAHPVVLAQMAWEEQWQLRDNMRCPVDASLNRWIGSVYDQQASQRLLVFFEELSQAVAGEATVVAMVPGHVPIKEACIEALALTDEARSRGRLLRPKSFSEVQGSSWLTAAEKVLESFSRRLQCFQLVSAYGPCLYLSQDLSALGNPVLGILTSREGLDPEEPPPLALGLKVTLEGLSGDVINTVAAARDWTVGQLKDALASARRELRLLSSSEATDLSDDQRLSSLLLEDATQLTLRLLRVDPRWSTALQLVQGDAQSWRDLDEDLKSDRGLTLLAVSQEPSLLSEAQSSFLSDASVVLAAARKDSSSLQLASHELWNDDAFVEAAIALDAKKALQLALDSRLDELSPRHAQRAVTQDGLALEMLPAPLAQRPEILHAALEQDVCALQFAPEAMKDDAVLLETLLRRDGRALRYASRRLRGDRSLVLLAIATCPRVVLCASEEALKDPEVLGAAMDGDPQLVQQLAIYASRI